MAGLTCSLVLLALATLIPAAGSQHARWMQGQEHIYSFDSSTSSVSATAALNRGHNFPLRTRAEFRLVSLGYEQSRHHMRLVVVWVDFFRIEHGIYVRQPHAWNLDGWFSFMHEDNGLIKEVRYPPGEDIHVVNIKKGILGSLISHQLPPEDAEWTDQGDHSAAQYDVEGDYDHQGLHNSTYHVRRFADGSAEYRKVRRQSVGEGQHLQAEKTVTMDHTAMLKSVAMTEKMTAGRLTADPARPVRESPHLRPNRWQSTHTSENRFGSFLQTHTRSLVNEHVVEDRTNWQTRSIRSDLGHENDIDITDADAHDMDDVTWTAQADTAITHVESTGRDAADAVPDDLVSDGLQQEKPPKDLPNWEETYSILLDALDCLELSDSQGSARRSQCVSALLRAVGDASEENVAWLGRVYLAADMIPERRAALIDALVEKGSPAAQQAIIDWVLRAEKPLMGDLMRALTDLATMDPVPTPAMIDMLEEIVFQPSNTSLRAQTQTVREQAMLTLGALINALQSFDSDRADRLTANFIDWLYNSGPTYSERARRSTLEKQSDHRIPVIYALGNSRHPMAEEHLILHASGDSEDDVFTSAAHRIRHTAVTALADFETPAAEQALLHSAFFDPNIAIRRNAIHGFRSRQRSLHEESVPCPSSVPDSPANALLAKHRADYQRSLGEPEEDILLEAPDRPLSAMQLWEKESIEANPYYDEDMIAQYSYQLTRSVEVGNETLPEGWLALSEDERQAYELKAKDQWDAYLVEQEDYRAHVIKQPSRRALFGLELDIKISLPGVGFTLPIGSHTIGAEFGLKFSAAAQIYFSILKSRFSVDVLGQAYGRLYVGFMESIIGFDHLDIFTAYAAFKGGIGFDLSMIMDFDLDDIVRMFNKVQEAAVNLMDRIQTAINQFMTAIGVNGGCGAVCIFNNLGGMADALPDIANQMVDMVTSLEDYVGPNATKTIESDRLKKILQAVYALTYGARDDIQKMYTLVYDTVKVTLPGLAQNISDTAQLIVEAIEAIPDCPVAATFALMNAKDDIEEDIGTVLALKVQFEDAFFITTGELPSWLNPGKEVVTILKELGNYLVFHVIVMAWGCDLPTPAKPKECAINRTVYDQEIAMNEQLEKMKLIGGIFTFIQDTIVPPIETATQLYSDITQTWDKMKAAYDTGRAIFDALFGVKFHKTFSRVVRDSSGSCGAGLYPANDHKGAVGVKEQAVWGDGIDILVLMSETCNLQCQANPRQQYKKDSYSKSTGKTSTSNSQQSSAPTKKFITAPLKGTLKFYNSTTTNILILRPSSFSVKKYELIISNINILPEITDNIKRAGVSGFPVLAGYQLGTPTQRGQCEDFVHVSMRLRADITKYNDPKAYLEKSPLSFPQWVSEADQWYIKLLMITIKQGTFGALFDSVSDGEGREKKSAKAPSSKKKRDLTDVTNAAAHWRARRDVCSEFADAPDFCMSAGLPAFSKKIVFFKREFFMVIGGFIPITLGFEIGGEFSVLVKLDFCLLTLKVTVTPIPGAVATFDVYAAVGTCFVMCGGLKISGKVADLKFPLPITIGFKDKPISVTVALNMELIPLSIIFSGFVEAIDSTIFSMDFFKFSMDPIKKNIFTLTTKSKDTSPPVFTTQCAVEQAVGRDPTAPGVLLSFAAKDDDTKVVTTSWYVGTALEGSDVSKEAKLDPSLKVSFQPLTIASAKQVFFTVKACNVDEFCSTSSCQLPSWDLDATRFTAVQDFDFQSHPSEIEGTFSAEDESAIVDGTLQWAYGTAVATVEKLNDTAYGSDIQTWRNSPVPAPMNGPLAHKITGVRGVIKVPFDLHHNEMYFLNVKAQNRLGFWGAGGSKGVLIDLIPPFPAPLVDPDRCRQFYFDFYASPDVYENLTHQGPYNAGVLGCSWSADGMLTEHCAHTKVIDWMGPKLNKRCLGPTYLPNHRQLKDSGTVYNGDQPGYHTLYQIEQTFVSLNWLPSTDLETGIYMYAWALGSTPCASDVLRFIDPFDAQRDSSTWSYTGARGNIDPPLPEGRYYFVVRAFNNVQRGGPLATSVCNSVPLVVDLTKPILNSFLLGYVDETSRLEAYYNVSDDLSDIQKVKFGLGYTPDDQDLRAFADYFNRTHLGFPGSILPVGVFMFGRMRIVNNVNLYTTVASDKALFLDFTPPLAGDVYDGTKLDIETPFTYTDNQISANWNNFFDPESGIELYQIGVSRGILVGDLWTPDTTNASTTMPFVNLTAQTFVITLNLPTDIILEHNVKYFTTIIGYHRGHRHMSNSSRSSGFLVDKTCPSFNTSASQLVYWGGSFSSSGPLARCQCPCFNCSFSPSDFGNLCTRTPSTQEAFIRDGTPSDYVFDSVQGAWGDLQYSADNTVVDTYWSGFNDLESGIAYYRVAVGLGTYDPLQGITIVKPEFYLPFTKVGNVLKFRKTTFSFSDGDRIFVSVEAVNNAGLGTVATSDGFVIDLSAPELLYVNDGPGAVSMYTPPGPLLGESVKAYGEGPELRFRADALGLESHWSFYDLQSGIAYYEIGIFKKASGGDVRIYPVATEWLRSDVITNTTAGVSVVTWDGVIDNTLATGHQMKFVSIRVSSSVFSEAPTAGSTYFFRIRAYNYAKVMASGDSNGIKIDFSAPALTEVTVGVLNTDAENVRQEVATGIAQVVVTADPRGVKAHWGGRDPESGIDAFYVSVGHVPLANPLVPYVNSLTNADLYRGNSQFVATCTGCSVTSITGQLPEAITSGSLAGFIYMGSATSSYVDISPLSFEIDSYNVRYVVTVAAVNGAGLISKRSSKPFRLANADIAGTVYDGPDMFIDIALQTMDTITVNFFGWQSDMCGGMMGFEWAIGSTPGGTEVQGFTPEGITMMGDHGTAQAPTPGLSHNQTYYATVRGVTMCRIQNQGRFDAIAATQGPQATKAVEFVDIGRQFIESTSSGVLVDKTKPAFRTLPELVAAQQFDSTKFRAIASNVPTTLAVTQNSTVHVEVKAESGRTQSYYVTVVAGTASSVAALSNLTVVRTSVLSGFNFSQSATTFNATVPFGSTSIILSPSAQSSGATIFVGLRDKVQYPVVSGRETSKIPLKVGVNLIDIRVLAEDKFTVNRYTVRIVRTAAATACTATNVSIYWDSTLKWSTASSIDGSVVSIPYRFTSFQFSVNYPISAQRAFFDLVADGVSVSTNIQVVPGRVSEAISFTQSAVNLSITIVAEDGTTSSLLTITIQRLAAENVSTLSSLVTALPVGAVGIAPVLSTTAGGYTLLVDSSCGSVQLNFTTTSRLANISFQGSLVPYFLSTIVSLPWNGSLSFDVVAESSFVNTIMITISRRAASNDASIVAMNIFGLTADLSLRKNLSRFSAPVLPTQASFTVSSIPFEYSKVGITLFLSHPRASVQAFYRDTIVSVSLLGSFPYSTGSEFVISVPPQFSAIPYSYVSDNAILLQVTAEDNTTIVSTNITLNYQLPSSTARLQSLSAAYQYGSGTLNMTLQPAFNINITRYSCRVPFSSAKILVSALSIPFAKTSGAFSGQAFTALSAANNMWFTINPGETEISIQSLAQDGLTSKVYTILVGKDTLSNSTAVSLSAADASAQPLSVVVGSFSFAVAVPFGTKQVKLSLQAAFPFTNLSAPGAIGLGSVSFLAKLSGRTTTINFIATSESGIVQPYTVVVTAAIGSLDASLSKVLVRSPNNDTYSLFAAGSLSDGAELVVTVAYSVASVWLSVGRSNNGSTVSLALGSSIYVLSSAPISLKLDAGLRTNIQIVTTSQSLTVSTTVKVIVQRAAPDDNAQLLGLDFVGQTLQPAFAANITSYTVAIYGTSTLRIKPVLPTGVLYSTVYAGLIEYLSGQFTSDPASLKIAWDLSDLESGMQNSTLAMGTYPWGDTVLEASFAPLSATSFALSQLGVTPNFTVALEGLPLGSYVSGSNTLNITAIEASNFVTVDITPPSIDNATVVCPRYQSSLTTVTCSWYGFADSESTLTHYLFGVGSAPGDSSLYASSFIGWTHTFSADVQLSHGQVFYVTVTAVNNVGMESSVSSGSITADITAPVSSGRVWETGDEIDFVLRPALAGSGIFNILAQNASQFRFNVQYELGDVVSFGNRQYQSLAVFDSGMMEPTSDPRWALVEDSQCQRSRARIHVAWDPFTDPESSIDHYELALGTTVGGLQVSRGWIIISPWITEYTIVEDANGDDLQLLAGMYVYARIKAVNGVNMSLSLSSNGIGIAVPEITGRVFDGSIVGVDAATQHDPHTISASWTTNDPCPVEMVEVRVIRGDDFVIQDWMTLWSPALATTTSLSPPTQAKLDVPSYIDQQIIRIDLQNERRYFFQVRLTNSFNQQALLSSNGVTVQVEPPVRGVVYDGPFTAQDINVQASVTEYTANWQDCLQCVRQKLECGPCFGATAIAKGLSIAWYAVALGSSPAFARTKSNIVPFTNVGLNTSVLFSLADPLTPKARYYFTLRAYTMPDVYTEATSNGIAGGYSIGVQAGWVTAPQFVNSIFNISVAWGGFETPLPIYTYAIAVVPVGMDSASANFTSLGVKFEYTFANLTGVMVHNGSYSICVKAIDQSLSFNTSCSSPLLVDLTPPCSGTILHINSEYSPNLSISYEAHDTHLAVSWSGFFDNESGLSKFSAVVVEASTCNVPLTLGYNSTTSGTCPLPDLSGTDSLPWKLIGDASTFNFSYALSQGDTLDAKKRYVVLIKATNRAGSSVVASSPTILLDADVPSSGLVKDGGDFRGDLVFQQSESSVSAAWTHAFVSSQLDCPISVTYRFKQASPAWSILSRYCREDVCSPSFPANPDLLGDGVTYSPDRVAYDINGAAISLVHPRGGLTYTGALYTQLEGGVSGEYTFLLQPGGGVGVISSIIWWGGDIQDLQDPVYVPPGPSTPATMDFSSIVTYDSFGNPINTLFRVNALGVQFLQLTDDSSSWVMVIWSSEITSIPTFTAIPLDFDPSASMNEYRIELTTGLEKGVKSQGDLYINGAWRSRFFSFLDIQDAKFGFNLYPTSSDVSVVAVYRVTQAILPSKSDLLCRYGSAFYEPTSAIVKYQWAIGTLRDPITKNRLDPASLQNVDDVLPFTDVPASMFCRPCLANKPCEAGECSAGCNASQPIAISVTAANLSLSAGSWFARCNQVRYGPTCLSVCPANITYEDYQDNVCKDCHALCINGCLGPLDSDCRECKVLKEEGRCVAACSIGYYDNGDGACLPCHPLCLLTPSYGCFGANASSCDRCSVAARVVDGVATCVSACPYLTYSQDLYSIVFNNKTGKNESVVQEGKAQCTACDSSCGTGCVGPLSVNCTDCNAVRNTTLSLDQWLAKGESVDNYDQLEVNNPPKGCVVDCPANAYIGSDNVCRPCHASCSAGCLGPDFTDCLFCPRFTDSSTRRCVDWCQSYQFASPSNVCYNCSAICSGPVAAVPNSTLPGVSLYPYGALVLNSSLLRVSSSSNLTFSGSTGCKKVIVGSNGEQDASYVNVTQLMTGNTSAVYPLVDTTDPLQSTLTKLKIRVKAQDSVTVSEISIRVTRLPVSDDTSIKTLSLTDNNIPLTIIPDFVTTVFSYSTTVAYSVTNLSFTSTAHPFGSIRLQSDVENVTLGHSASGSQLQLTTAMTQYVFIYVTSESGVEGSPYKLKINRQVAAENALLSALSLTYFSDGSASPIAFSPSFDASVSAYQVSMPFRTVWFKVAIATSDPYYTVALVNGNQVLSGATSSLFYLNETSVVTVNVTAESGHSFKLYTLSVSRAQPSSNAQIRNFVLTAPYGVTFDTPILSGKTVYTASVLYAVASFSLDSITLADKGAAYVVADADGAAVVLGQSMWSTTLNITVTAEDQTTIVSTIITIVNLPANTDATLSAASLTFLNRAVGLVCGSFSGFVPSEPTCSAVVSSRVQWLQLTASTSSAFSSVTLLVDGSVLVPAASVNISSNVTIASLNSSFVLSLLVVSQSNDTLTYRILVDKSSPSRDSSISALSSSVGSFSPSFLTNITQYQLPLSIEDQSVSFSVSSTYPTATVAVGYLQNVDNSSISLSCQAQVIAVATCSSICVQSSVVTVTQPGVFGLYGYTTVQRQTRNVTTYLNATAQRQCTLTTTTTTRTLFVTTALDDSGYTFSLFGSGLEVRILVIAENGVTNTTYAVSVSQSQSSDATLSSVLFTFVRPDGTTLLVAPIFDDNNTAVLDTTSSLTFNDASFSVALTPAARKTNIVLNYTTSQLANYSIVWQVGQNKSSTLPVEYGTLPNVLRIRCRAPDGISTAVYVIKINRPLPSSESLLSDLGITSPADTQLSPLYLKGIFVYSVSVAHSVRDLSLIAFSKASTATMQLGYDLNPDVPLPIDANPGDLFKGYCVVAGGFGYTAVNFSNGAYNPNQRTGTWSFAAVAQEAGLTVDNAGFIGTPTPAPQFACTALGGHCTNCTSFLLPSGICVDACPAGTYADGSSVCQACHGACARNCFGPDADQCLPYCRNTTTPLLSGGVSVVTSCSNCSSISLDGVCLVGSCPDMYYADSASICRRCNSECKDGCTGPSGQECTRCVNVFQPLGNSTRIIGTCQANCNASFYLDSAGVCQPCHSQCVNGCYGGGGDQCNRTAIVAVGVNPYGCANLSFNGSCVLSCPVTTYIQSSTKQCLACHSSCILYGCTGPSIRECKRMKLKSSAIIAGVVQDAYFVPGTYYVTVKAIDAASNVAYSTSTGVTVDYTPPAVYTEIYHANPELDPANPEKTSYLPINYSMGMVWDFQDLESGVSRYEYCLGLTNETCDVIPFTDPGADDYGNLISQVIFNVSMTQGVKYYGLVRASNYAGLNITASSGGVVVDMTPPIAGNITIALTPARTLDGITIFEDGTIMAINWSSFYDPESLISGYDWGIGLTPYTAEVLPWTPVGKLFSSSAYVQGRNLFVDDHALDPRRPWETGNKTLNVLLDSEFRMQPGIVYYNNLRAWNGALLNVPVSSPPFMILRPDDQILRTTDSGEFFLTTNNNNRRRRSVNFTDARMFVEVPTGGIGEETVVAVLPLTEADFSLTYTFGTGSQLDVFGRKTYTVNESAYLHNPADFPGGARMKVEFSGLSFAMSPVAIENATRSETHPITIGTITPFGWNNTPGWAPRWMYWSPSRQQWLFVDSTCGSEYRDHYTDLTAPLINITAKLCDPYNPIYPTCPNSSVVCQSSGKQAPSGTQCVFPFTYKGTTYSSCTTTDSPSGQRWCGTKSVVADGAWGYCNCSVGSAASACYTQGSMATPGTPCKFPFTANGQTYNSCAPGLGQTWCATQSTYADGNWGFCSCFNSSYDTSACSKTPSNATRVGPTGPVQVALMVVSFDGACNPPVVSDQVIGPLVQGYSRSVYIYLNYTAVEGDLANMELISNATYGDVDASRLLTDGLVKYRIKDSYQYFYGIDTFDFRAMQTGLTADGRLSPCAPLRSAPGQITVNVTNVNDAPVLLLDVFAQPTAQLAERYLNNSLSRFAFDVYLLEDQPFSILLTVQDHDLDELFDIVVLDAPTPIITPDWVLPYAPAFANATVKWTPFNMHAWSKFGEEGQLRIDYTPSQYYNGADFARITFRDLPPDGNSLYASTAPFEFRFNITAVNNPPFSLAQTFSLRGEIVRSKLPLIRRLRYYDIELPHVNLSVSLSPKILGYYDPTSNVTHSITTAHGTITLLPASTENASDATANAIMFRYDPSGSYSATDSFQFWVSDGEEATFAVVTIKNLESGGFPDGLIVAIVFVMFFCLAILVAYFVYRFYYKKSSKVGPAPAQIKSMILFNTFVNPQWSTQVLMEENAAEASRFENFPGEKSFVLKQKIDTSVNELMQVFDSSQAPGPAPTESALIPRKPRHCGGALTPAASRPLAVPAKVTAHALSMRHKQAPHPSIDDVDDVQLVDPSAVLTESQV